MQRRDGKRERERNTEIIYDNINNNETCIFQVKTTRIKGEGPVYRESVKFILPEQFLPTSSVLILLKLTNQTYDAVCVSGPWTTYSDGRLTHWGEMLMQERAVLQWRMLYPYKSV